MKTSLVPRTNHYYSSMAVVLILATGLLSLSSAFAVPLATSYIEYSCYGRGELSTQRDEDSKGPLPVGLSGSCDVFGTGVIPPGYYYRYEGAADIIASLGPAIPQVGNVHVTASAFNASRFESTRVSGSGAVSFYFAIEQYSPAPWNPPNLPIYFEARGEGSLTRISDPNPVGVGGGVFGRYYAYAQLASAYFTVDSGNFGSNGFSQSVSLSLQPNDPLINPYYRANLGAGCSVNANGWVPELPQQGECTAVVDPLIRLDQAAFDALYGADSFPLADYYRLEFSANAGVVPVPAAVWLFGSGLLGLIGVARRTRR